MAATRTGSPGRKDQGRQGIWTLALARGRRFAWIIVLIPGVGFLLWGGMAALAPEHLLGPGSAPILPAGYEGFTRSSWLALAAASPATAGYMTLLFRVYGAFNVAFGVLAVAINVTAFRRGEGWAWWALLLGYTIALGSAMAYDRIVNAIGPFELSEYLGLALIYLALAITAPFIPSAGRREPAGMNRG
jgi:hypothetical protein